MNKILSKDIFKSLMAVLVLVGVFYYSYEQTHQKKRYNPFAQKLISPGGIISLDESTKDKLVFLYFGFLSCPDACPTTLSEMSSIFKSLTPKKLEKIRFIFIGLDPERDSIDRMAKYTSHFHEKITPVTLDLASLGAFTSAFGISYSKVQLKSSMGYTIDHSTQIVILSPDKKESYFLEHDITRDQKIDHINKYLKQYFQL